MRSIWNIGLCAAIVLLWASFTEAARLTDWSSDRRAPFTFYAQCEGSNEVLLVQRSTNLVDWTTFQRSIRGGTNRLIEIPKSFYWSQRNFFRAIRTNEPVFAGAIVTKHGIDLNGNNVRVDSFDSANPLYSTNGQYIVTKARDQGDVISNDTITNAISVGNAHVFGRVHIGLGGTVAVGPNGGVGDSAWHAAGNRGIQSGFLRDDMDINFADVSLPAGSDGWPPPGGGGFVDGILYNWICSTDGDYRLSGTLSGKILIAANVRLRIEGGIDFHGNDCIRLMSNGTVTIYMNGLTANLTGAGIINPYAATNFMYFGTKENTALQIRGNANARGAFYAPYANAQLVGGGGTNEFSGSIVANTLGIIGHISVHFDEDLASSGPKN